MKETSPQDLKLLTGVYSTISNNDDYLTKLLNAVSTCQGAHWSGKSQGKLFFLQGQGKVREFCKMVRENSIFSKVREKSGKFEIIF